MNRILTTQGWLVFLLILAVLSFVVLILFGFFRNEEVFVAVPESEEVTTAVETTPTRMCFSRAGEATGGAPYAVSESIELTITGDTVTGTKKGTQAGPDMTNGYDGTLVGAKLEDNLDLVYTYTIEGSAQQERELYTLTIDGLQKHRYVLKEEGDMLVPDVTSTPTIVAYQPTACEL